MRFRFVKFLTIWGIILSAPESETPEITASGVPISVGQKVGSPLFRLWFFRIGSVSIYAPTSTLP